MRSMESNFRGVRSESGIFTANSCSSAATRSASVNESSTPDWNSDSSGAAWTFLPATRFTISRILACVSIFLMRCLLSFGRTIADLRAHLPVLLELLHDIGEHGFRQLPIARHGEVHEVPLRHARVHPIAHRALAAHALARIPVGAAALLAGGLLRLDDEIDAIHNLPLPADIPPTVRRTHHENRSRRSRTPQPVEQVAEHGLIPFRTPARIGRLIRAVSQHDQA